MPDAGAGGRRGRQDLARLSLDAGRRGAPAVNARDRIGKGPWTNSKGAVVAKDVADLHGANNLTKQTASREKGDLINGRGDTAEHHDVLTGSQPDGTAFAGGEDRTCKQLDEAARTARRWSAIHDRMGLR